MQDDDSKLDATLAGQAALLTELLSTAMEPHLRRAGISQATFDLLSAVHASNGGASQAELARRLRVSPPTLSQAIGLAEQRGLVERGAKNGDARVKVVRLTPQGKRAVTGTLHAVNQLERQLVESLDANELKSAVSVLRKANRSVAALIRASA